MNTLSLRLKQRPIRIGWCVKEGSFPGLVKAMQLTSTLWGGIYNPIISIGDPKAATTVAECFRVDWLFPVTEDAEVANFVKSCPQYRNPLFWDSLTIDNGKEGKLPILPDILQAGRFERRQTQNPPTLYLFGWNEAEPLQHIFRAMFGELPPKDVLGIDYRKDLESFFHIQEWNMFGEVSPESAHLVNLSNLSKNRLPLEYRSAYWRAPGFYIGDANNFSDLVYFWNLRASGLSLRFFDPAHSARLEAFKKKCSEQLTTWLADRPKGEREISLWTRNPDAIGDASHYGEQSVLCTAGLATWNGLNLLPAMPYFEESSALGVVEESRDGAPWIRFQLPERKFVSGRTAGSVSYMIGVSPFGDLDRDTPHSVFTPYVPQLNEFFGRECSLNWRGVRVESDGLAIATEVLRDQVSYRALDHHALIGGLFSQFGMKVEPSHAGRVGKRLIRQMEGLRGCMVFKIEGVRRLIGKYSASDSFDKDSAVGIIGNRDPESKKPQFEKYESLFIDRGGSRPLKPGYVFKYLLKRKVFQAGLDAECPSCELKFWLALDDFADDVSCVYCREQFNLAMQLGDQGKWRYRRSGLFGMENKQEGGIAVAVTLQQFHAGLHNAFVYSTGMNIAPSGANIEPCESDFIAISKRSGGKTEIAVGECKTARAIEEQDVRKLMKVADALEDPNIEPFIVFSKLGVFSPEEIALCKTAQGKYRRRVILLEQEDLETYHVFESRMDKNKGIRLGDSFEDMAVTTEVLYYKGVDG